MAEQTEQVGFRLPRSKVEALRNAAELAGMSLTDLVGQLLPEQAALDMVLADAGLKGVPPGAAMLGLLADGARYRMVHESTPPVDLLFVGSLTDSAMPEMFSGWHNAIAGRIGLDRNPRWVFADSEYFEGKVIEERARE